MARGRTACNSACQRDNKKAKKKAGRGEKMAKRGKKESRAWQKRAVAKIGLPVIATVPGDFAAWGCLSRLPPHLASAIFSAMSLSSRHCALVMVSLSVCCSHGLICSSKPCAQASKLSHDGL